MSNQDNDQNANEEIIENAAEAPYQIDMGNEETSEETNENVESVVVDEVATLQQALLESNAKVEENWNHFLSAKAEANNIQKRAERDVANAHKYALDKFIPELLGVKDSLELGTKAAKEGAESDNTQLATFIEGSDMAITMFNDVLAKQGVTMINPEGEIFNPELHQAITMVPNPELAPNTIIEVIQKGYTLNERLLRPAMVIVSQ